MPEYRGMAYLKNKLAAKQSRVRTRYKYYEMKYNVRDFGISTPPALRNMNYVLGWCGKAVDSLADRLQFRGFQDDNFDLEEIYSLNNQDILFDSAILGALISACDFIYVSVDETGYPRLMTIDGYNATGVIDPVSYLLKEGYAVLERDKNGKIVEEAYFLPEETQFFRNGEPDGTLKTAAPAPLLVPIIHRPDAIRPFGHSRISRACMSIISSAVRTSRRAEISAEFFSFPQRAVIGTDPDAEQMDKWKVTMSSLLEITRDEEGNVPSITQFAQQSMEPHIAQFRMYASAFAGETGLTLDDLGFATENPSSAEAIKASHENLRLAARKAQRSFGTGFLNAGYLAACVRDNFVYRRQQLALTKPIWEPIFEPDAAMLSSIGDGAGKINQAVPGFFNKETLRNLTGIEGGNGNSTGFTPADQIRLPGESEQQ